MTKEDIIDSWMKQDIYVDILEAKAVDGQKESCKHTYIYFLILVTCF